MLFNSVDALAFTICAAYVALNSITLFENQFSKLSVDEKHGIVALGAKDFILQFSGRDFVSKCEIEIELKPRHDILKMIYGYTLHNLEDTVTISVTLPETIALPIIAAGPETVLKQCHRERYDLNQFTPLKKGAAIADSVLMLGESHEAMNFIMDSNFKEFISNNESTNQLTLPLSKPSLSCCFSAEVSSLKNKNDYLAMNELLFYILDKIEQMKLSPETLQKIKNSRKEAAEVIYRKTRKDRERIAQEKKIEKRRMEERRMQKLSPEEQRKFEEKMKKKEQKKNIGGLALVGLSIAAIVEQNSIHDFVMMGYPVSLLIIGALFVLLGLFGMWATGVQSVRMIRLYLIVLSIIIILQVVLTAVALSQHDKIDSMVKDGWYSANPSVIQNVEQMFECCGYRNVLDHAIPADCTKDPNFGFKRSCRYQIVTLAQRHTRLLGIVGLILGVMEFVALICASILLYQLGGEDWKREGSILEEARSWLD
ncbi:Tetraspanin/Peripherin domain-containing protein [Rozella allomycis CSF55]|uniref:Tetraspanin/Peripherin domain-containing protein n=1 Tax=Rozella allomycis (strain CSF55) TaxID=988480 RepID=A0A075AST0_ROZAC|nr:Tetraspanin/Peripherin domain-containing protein [Rozella allomycis CSF55]|eukprot:EPZ33323.1 Tetraspanin/Peripherin domain-containing protein [Rozella allomycis CSF55]